MESDTDIKTTEEDGCEMEETLDSRCCCYAVEPCGCDFDPYECDVDTYCC